jgi:DUF4097 and DUF4098 domain-containing protein YvlB
MLRFFIRLSAVVIVASLPIPLHAQAPPAPPMPPAPTIHIHIAPLPPLPDLSDIRGLPSAEQFERIMERAAARAERQVERAASDLERMASRTATVHAADIERMASQTVAAATTAAVSAVAASASAWHAKSWAESAQSKQGPEFTERILKTFKVGPNGSLDISNVSGDIIVNEGGGDTITIDAMKKFRGSDADAKTQFARVEVTMVERGGRVEVKTIYDRNTKNHKAWVDYTVTAPAGSSIYAHAISGDIKVSNIKGEVRIDTVSGDVNAVGTPGATLVKTVSGDANVSGVSNANDLRAMTVSGDVTVTGAKVRTIDADSISGTVHLADVTCERATAKSISGDIAFGGSLAKNGRYEFKSQSGDIRVTVAGAPGFELDASSFSGNVRSDLPLTLPAGTSVGGHGPGKKIRGTHGDGSAQLVLTSFSGDIVIAKK